MSTPQQRLEEIAAQEINLLKKKQSCLQRQKTQTWKL